MNFLHTLSEPNVIAGVIATALIVAAPAAWGLWLLRRRVQNLRQDLEFISIAQRRDSAIVEASGEGVLEIDSADRVRYANPAAARLLGYEGGDDLLGLNFRTLINDSDERGSHVIHRGATTDFMTGVGAVLKRKDDKHRPVEYRVVPITPHRGPGSMVLAFRDVSERVRLDAMLSDMQATALVGGWELDLTTGRIFWTDAVYAIHDLVAGTPLTVESCQSFFAEPHRTELRRVLQQAQTTGQTGTLQLPLTSARGRNIWARLVIKADMRGGQVVRLHGIIQDVTDRVIAERQVIETRDFYELTLNAIPTLVIYVDRNQVVTYVNKAAEEFAGLPRDECIGRALSAFYLPEEFTVIAGHVEAALRGVAGTIKQSTTRSGRTRDWQNHFVPEFEQPTDGEAGAVRGFFVIGYDLTEIKRLEARLLQAQKMEAIGQLTGGIAHDFNNLLGVVLGNLQLLERGVDDNPNLARKVHTAMRAAMRGADLTRRLLALARRQMLDPNVVDLNRQLTGLADLMQRTLGESIEVRMVQAHDLWHTRVDAGQFENAILNLAINARDAMVRGGRLTVHTQNVRLDADFTRVHPQVEPGEFVSVSVTDNGVGIEPEVLARVFEPFFTTKESGRGSGLGLAMVHGFAEQAGGVATISSEVGKGTTVQILLPRCREENSVREDTIVTRFAPKGHETILVVEDDADLRDTVVTALTQFGYHALSAPNAAAALQILGGSEHVDLLFTDIMMPGGTLGPELARRARELRPRIEVLFTTGYADSAVLSGGISPTEILHKPYRNEELALRVRHVLDREARVA